MRSVYIIAGGILAVIAVVFLAPQKQNNTEEKASASLDEIDAAVLEQFGPDLTPEEKELARQDVADQLARDKAEMRKYGRILTPNERSTQWWQDQDKAAKRDAYAALCAQQKEWIDNFPFQLRYHPDILYDPENIAHSDAKFHAYQKELERKADELKDRNMEKEDEIWARDDLPPRKNIKSATNSTLRLKNPRTPTRKLWRNAEL